jgi:SAM-dependent methyltransferase
MLINQEEYARMHQVETSLWWYKVLHYRVLHAIQAVFLSNKNIRILDAGCGTGGLLSFLKSKGYSNLEGFDYSDFAVAFSESRSHKVQKADITNLGSNYQGVTFDVIVCNDVLYQFENEVVEKTLSSLLRLLSPQGIIISNNQALAIFEGTHDIAVGAKQRFTQAYFKGFSARNNLNLLHITYWSFVLSPLILAIRQFQQLQLKVGLVKIETIQSDVNLPMPLVNKLLFFLANTERKWFKKLPFGSSVFWVLRP